MAKVYLAQDTKLDRKVALKLQPIDEFGSTSFRSTFLRNSCETNSIVRNTGSSEMDEGIGSETRGNLDDDVDALFKLPLAEFTGVRNHLAARLKREGRANDSYLVKALAKPSISAWAVNQLHWKHREAFDRLLATSQRFRQSQTAHTAGRIADLRGSLDARGE